MYHLKNTPLEVYFDDMQSYSIFKLLVISIFLSRTKGHCAHGGMRNEHYDLRDQDKGTNQDILKVTTARSSLQCMTLCMTTEQCVTAGYVDNKCTLSARRIDGLKSYSNFISPGERLYTGKKILIESFNRFKLILLLCSRYNHSIGTSINSRI